MTSHFSRLAYRWVDFSM